MAIFSILWSVSHAAQPQKMYTSTNQSTMKTTKASKNVFHQLVTTVIIFDSTGESLGFGYDGTKIFLFSPIFFYFGWGSGDFVRGRA